MNGNVLCSQAEEMIRKVEREEEHLQYAESMVTDKSELKSYHACIINLVIGTLYCSKVRALISP